MMPISAAGEAGASALGGRPQRLPFVAAVGTNAEGHSLRMKLTVADGLRTTDIAAWAQQHLAAGTRVCPMAWSAFMASARRGALMTRWWSAAGGPASSAPSPELRWVNTIPGNVKRALRGAYHAIYACASIRVAP